MPIKKKVSKKKTSAKKRKSPLYVDRYYNVFWYYLDAGHNQQGPYSFEAIKTHILEKRIKNDTGR